MLPATEQPQIKVGDWIVCEDRSYPLCGKVTKVMPETIAVSGLLWSSDRGRRIRRDDVLFAGTETQCRRVVQLLSNEKGRFGNAYEQLRKQHLDRKAKIIGRAQSEVA